MIPAEIDYEAKIIIPTRELYQELSTQAGELFSQAKHAALELHTKISELSMELYNHPIETTARWQAAATDKGNELYTLFNTKLIPEAKADYQYLVNITIDYGSQFRAAIQVFLDNPEAVTVKAFTLLNLGLMEFLNQSLHVSSTALNEITTKADKIITLLLDRPLQTIENIYYDSLSLLLNSYFDMVSSLINSFPKL